MAIARWGACTGVEEDTLKLRLGSTSAGSDNRFDSGTTAATKSTATKLSTDGSTINACLLYKMNRVWESPLDYIYTAAQRSHLQRDEHRRERQSKRLRPFPAAQCPESRYLQCSAGEATTSLATMAQCIQIQPRRPSKYVNQGGNSL